MIGRGLVPLAERFAVDIAPGSTGRPTVLLGQHLRLFLECYDAHDASLYSLFNADRNVQSAVLQPLLVLHSPFGVCTGSAVRSAVHEEKRNENPNASFFSSGTCAWCAARGISVVRRSRR